MLERWHKEWQFLIRSFLFFLGIITISRIAFLVIFYSEWNTEGTMEGLLALWYGTRLSLKSAGHPVVFLLLCCSLPAVFIKAFNGLEKWRNFWVGAWILLFVVLIFARYPYYHNFGRGFDMSIFFGIHEDPWVLLWTVNQDYPLIMLVFGIFLATFVLFLLWQKIYRLPYWQLPNLKGRIQTIGYQLLVIGCLIFLGITAGNGGSPLEAWAFRLKNSAVLGNDTLNEAIIDEVQGLYRARDEHRRLMASGGKEISQNQMKSLLQRLSPEAAVRGSTELQDYIVRSAKGGKIERPKKIFIIIAESYAQWTMLPEYQDYGVSNELLAITKKPESAWIKSVLANGDSTMYAILAVVTGLTEMGQVMTYQPESHRAPYETGLAPQMERLGYESYFWYGGPSSWMGLRRLALSQGFKEFSGSGELGLGASENRWGASDKDFLQIAAREIENIDTPSVHVVLTVSNHSPYTIDLEAEGFPGEKVQAAMSKDMLSDKNFLIELGHQWYADREMGRFINRMREKEPDSLFIVFGDHGSRNMYPSRKITMYQKRVVPVVFYGKGVSPELFKAGISGNQTQLIPTLIELIAPQGFIYYGVQPSLTEGEKYGINSGFWLTDQGVGSRWENQQEGYHGQAIEPIQRDLEWEEAVLGYSWWRATKGTVVR